MAKEMNAVSSRRRGGYFTQTQGRFLREVTNAKLKYFLELAGEKFGIKTSRPGRRTDGGKEETAGGLGCWSLGRWEGARKRPTNDALRDLVWNLQEAIDYQQGRGTTGAASLELHPKIALVPSLWQNRRPFTKFALSAYCVPRSTRHEQYAGIQSGGTN